MVIMGISGRICSDNGENLRFGGCEFSGRYSRYCIETKWLAAQMGYTLPGYRWVRLFIYLFSLRGGFGRPAWTSGRFFLEAEGGERELGGAEEIFGLVVQDQIQNFSE